ncbi:DUF3488 and transglutaminase-like domain-containing protein [Gulosibacter sp. 10]|uniref:DUF3488 and transglutaminase-like domain-containing protein n=1 Tax=Gulosibacter sp. 10 TaxID=1255570 RepID=UPI00097ECE5F|nr:DUF3488 and transglutaminase-like domain-containing protein [Gulosibacter sp. 10]SJM62311.1 Transglutaminase-like enzymes, putative cysteine proteases [Gulosibacter sp. 10]
MTNRGSWFVTIGLVGLVWSSALLALPLTSTPEWLLPAMITSLVVLVLMQGARQFTGSNALSILLGVATLAGAMLVLAQPTGLTDVFAAIGRQVTGLAEQLPNDQPPLRHSPPVAFMMGLATGALAIIADVLVSVLRSPSVGLVIAAPAVALPLAMGLGAAPWGYWLLFAALAVLHLHLGYRWLQQLDDEERTSRGLSSEGRGMGGLVGALTTGAVAITVAGLLAVMLPAPGGYWWQMVGSTASISTNRVNPIIDLGDDLRRDQPVEVLRYATSQTSGELPYLSLVSLTQLDSDADWQPGEFTPDLGALDGDLPLPGDLGNAPSTLAVNSNVVMEAGVSAYLPHPSTPVRLAAVDGEYGWSEATGDIRSVDEEALAQSFHVDSLVPRPSEAELRGTALPAGEQFAEYLQLPDDPALEGIRAQMESVISPNASPYQQALELQNWFRGGAFDYSELAPVSGGYDGTSLSVVEQFLQVRSGYCVHFASAMAVMGRLLDIPTRIQVGFTPGSFASVNELGQPVYSVTTNDLHAWAEFWVDGYGWVPFETTPSSGIGSTEVAEVGDEGEEVQTPPEETVAPVPTETAPQGEETTPETQPETDQQHADDSGEQEAEQGGAPEWAGLALTIGAIVLALAVLALLVLLPRLIRGRRRAARRALLRPGEDAAAPAAIAAAAWDEVRDSAADYGVHVPRGRTTGQQLRVLSAQLELEPGDAPSESLRRIGEMLDESAFSGPEHLVESRVEWEDVESVAGRMREHATDRQARRAKWAPASVLGPLRSRRRRGSRRTDRGGGRNR